MVFQPLTEVKVLDLTEGVAGPYACQLLGDLGADVIKVERPEGDWARGMGTSLNNNISTQYLALNRNKRNICLDLRKEKELEIAKKLIAKTDIMITSYRPGVMEKLGLGFQQVREINPTMIYGRVSGYGYEGELSQLPGVDTVVQAASGFMYPIGEPEGPPMRVSFPILDHGAARDLLVGIMAALYAKSRGEILQDPIDVDLLSTSAALQAQQWQEFLETGKGPARNGNRNPSLAPAGVYETKNGYLSIAVLRNEHWGKFCEALELKDLEVEPEFRTNQLRVLNRDKLESIIEPIMKSRTCEEWVSIFREHDLLVAEVNSIQKVRANEALFNQIPKVKVPLSETSSLEITSIGLPIKFGTQVNNGVRYPAAEKGEHTREILNEMNKPYN